VKDYNLFAIFSAPFAAFSRVFYKFGVGEFNLV
jgi:uncharacterized membrane protein